MGLRTARSRANRSARISPKVRPTAALAALLAGVLTGCAGSSHPAGAAPGSGSTVTPTASPTGDQPGAAGCSILSPPAVAKAASTAIASAERLALVFALRGLHNVPAEGCDFVAAPGGRLHKIEVRWTRQQADAIFAVLAKYDTAGLTHSPPGGQALAGSDVYWQSVGDTLWVRNGGTAMTVQFVTDAETDRYLPIAIALAKAALPKVASSS